MRSAGWRLSVAPVKEGGWGGQETERAPRVRGMVAGASPVLACARRCVAALGRPVVGPAWHEEKSVGPPNERMKQTSLVAAPGWQAEVPPRAPRGKVEGRTGSQLIPGVRPTQMVLERGNG